MLSITVTDDKPDLHHSIHMERVVNGFLVGLKAPGVFNRRIRVGG